MADRRSLRAMLAHLRLREAPQAAPPNDSQVATTRQAPPPALLLAAGALGYHVLLICVKAAFSRGGSRSTKASPAKPSLPPAHRPLAIIEKHAALVPPLVLPGSASAKRDLIAASPGRSSSAAGTPHSRRSEGSSRRQQQQQQAQQQQQQAQQQQLLLAQQQRAAEREQLAAATQTITQLQQQMDVVCREARVEVKRAAHEAARAHELAAGLENQLQMAVRQVAALQARSKALLSEKTAAERSCRELQAQLAGLQSALASNVRAYQQQVEVLQHKLQEVSKAREATDCQLSKIRKAAAAQQHRKQQGSASSERLKAEVELAREESAELRRACFELQEQLEAQRSAVAESNAALAAAQSQIRRLEAEARELPGWRHGSS